MSNEFDQVKMLSVYNTGLASVLSCEADWDTIYEVVLRLVVERSQMQKTIGELRGKLSAMTPALEEALDEWEHNSQYKGAYLKEKRHDLKVINEMRAKFLPEEVKDHE
jgi:hypothetical protein